MKVDPENQPIQFENMSCPYLGLKDDRVSYTAFPSRWNVCYHAQPPETPNFSHQRHFCLQTAHKRCHIFRAEETRKLPKAIRYQSKGLSKRTKRIILIGSISCLVILVFAGILLRDQWFNALVGMISFEGQVTETPFMAATAVPTQEYAATEDRDQGTQPSPTVIEPTDTPATIAPSPTIHDPILALDTPIGEEYQFVIHRVAEGESLQIFADQYNTSIEAINAVNHNLIAPLWINWLIIIPVNNTDVMELPTFEAYQVEEEISVRTLAEELSINLENVLFYNAIDSDHILHEGEWLLVPRE